MVGQGEGGGGNLCILQRDGITLWDPLFLPSLDTGSHLIVTALVLSSTDIQ